MSNVPGVMNLIFVKEWRLAGVTRTANLPRTMHACAGLIMPPEKNTQFLYKDQMANRSIQQWHLLFFPDDKQLVHRFQWLRQQCNCIGCIEIIEQCCPNALCYICLATVQETFLCRKKKALLPCINGFTSTSEEAGCDRPAYWS